MSMIYRIAIDRDHDGNFQDLGEDAAGQALDLRWRLGMARAFDSVADHSQAQITLRNRDGAFSPERHRLEIGTRLRIQSVVGTTRRTHFTGFITHVDVDGGEWGPGRAVIHAADQQAWLDDSPVRGAAQSDVRADQVIDALLDQALVRRAVIAGFCLIDVPGYNRIDSVRLFPTQNMTRRLQPGKTRFAAVGDWWRESTSTRQAIRDLAESERGRFYINRMGEAVFLNRHHTLVTKTIAATIANSMTALAYSYGDQRVNRLLLALTPREPGSPGRVLWRLAKAQRVPPHTPLLLNLPLVDQRGQSVGILALGELRAAFHENADASSPAITENVFAQVAGLGFTSLQVELRNSRARDVYLTDLRVIGKPLYRRDRVQIALEDGASLHLQGLRQMTLDLPALSDLETAQAFAAYELARRKQAAGAIQQLRLNAREHLPHALQLTLFDRIRVSEKQTGQLRQEYFIVGEAHHVSQGGRAHEVTWTLEPADATRFVIINSSGIDAADERIAPY